MNNIFRGLGIALVTPFTDDGKIDYESLSSIIEYQLSNDADFLCILATTGETPCLSTEEYWEVKEFIVKQVNAAIVNTLKTGNFHGVDGILSICPYYNKPSQEGLYQHFKAISEATKLPIVMYNVPGRTGVNMKPETTCRLANDCDNIVAIKEASGSIEQVDEIIKYKPKDFEVLSGDDAITFHMIATGAVGVISVIGNALPKEFSRMIRLEFRGQFEAAQKIHHKFTDLYSLLFVDGNPAGVKALMSEMGLLKNNLRLPLVPTRLTTRQKIAEVLKGLKL